MKYKLQKTADGSHTIYLPELDEQYHSMHGAIQEAEHVFIKSGLGYFQNINKLRVFEVGFGTGLNAFLTALYADANNIDISYESIEAYPLNSSIIASLNYVEELNANDKKDWFDRIHGAKWGEKELIHNFFKLKKIYNEIQSWEAKQIYDVIFFDAFGPRAQEEMWDKEIFAKLFEVLSNGGILVTYCAKGSVKRTLKEIGFEVQSLPGPPGKREMTRAIKSV